MLQIRTPVTRKSHPESMSGTIVEDAIRFA
jgi:hypothetical protein